MIKKELLLKQLDYIRYKIEILDMIEGKLLEMKALAQRIICEDLTDEEIQESNKQIKYLGKQVELLNKETTRLC